MLEYCETRLFPDGFPTESVLAVARDHFLTAGEVMAISIVQGGPCPNFLMHLKFVMRSADHL